MRMNNLFEWESLKVHCSLMMKINFLGSRDKWTKDAYKELEEAEKRGRKS